MQIEARSCIATIAFIASLRVAGTSNVRSDGYRRTRPPPPHPPPRAKPSVSGSSRSFCPRLPVSLMMSGKRMLALNRDCSITALAT